jgi:uncharacterized protein YndB with AHSA1/START domain
VTTPGEGGDVIVVERRIAAPPQAVFRYLTEPELWARWQGDRVELDANPGGAVRIHMPDGPTMEGSFVEIEPDRRVVITWGWNGHPRVPPGSTRVEFELIPDGTGTLLRLTHSGLPLEDLPIHLEGWDMYLPLLAAEVERAGQPVRSAET